MWLLFSQVLVFLLIIWKFGKMLSCFSLMALYCFLSKVFCLTFFMAQSYLYSIHAKMRERESRFFQETNPLKCLPTNEGKNPPFFQCILLIYVFFSRRPNLYKENRNNFTCNILTKQIRLKLGTQVSN